MVQTKSRDRALEGRVVGRAEPPDVHRAALGRDLDPEQRRPRRLGRPRPAAARRAGSPAWAARRSRSRRRCSPRPARSGSTGRGHEVSSRRRQAARARRSASSCGRELEDLARPDHDRVGVEVEPRRRDAEQRAGPADSRVSGSVDRLARRPSPWSRGAARRCGSRRCRPRAAGSARTPPVCGAGAARGGAARGARLGGRCAASPVGGVGAGVASCRPRRYQRQRRGRVGDCRRPSRRRRPRPRRTPCALVVVVHAPAHSAERPPTPATASRPGSRRPAWPRDRSATRRGPSRRSGGVARRFDQQATRSASSAGSRSSGGPPSTGLGTVAASPPPTPAAAADRGAHAARRGGRLTLDRAPPAPRSSGSGRPDPSSASA